MPVRELNGGLNGHQPDTLFGQISGFGQLPARLGRTRRTLHFSSCHSRHILQMPTSKLPRTASHDTLNEPNWHEFREEMPITERWAYFDHAAVGPLSSPAHKAVARWSRQAAEEGDTVWPQWEARAEDIRQTAAKMVGAQSQEIALVPNTTTGINLVAEGYPWREGDNVITVGGEFPSNLYPWINLKSRGVEERRVDLNTTDFNLDPIANACDQRTKIIAISWVGYATGGRIDLDQLISIAHDRGVLVFLDAIQGMGVFPLDVNRTPIDFFAADGHKWMLGPEGAGFMYIRKEHLELLRPLNVGWHSVVDSHDFGKAELNIRPDAARYEGGSQNMVGFLGLGASVDLLVRHGLTSTDSPIGERVLWITSLARQKLESMGATIVGPQADHQRSGIVAFEIPGRNPGQLRSQCLKQGVALSTRAGRMRISPHAYTNESDVERLIHALHQ